MTRTKVPTGTCASALGSDDITRPTATLRENARVILPFRHPQAVRRAGPTPASSPRVEGRCISRQTAPSRCAPRSCRRCKSPFQPRCSRRASLEVGACVRHCRQDDSAAVEGSHRTGTPTVHALEPACDVAGARTLSRYGQPVTPAQRVTCIPANAVRDVTAIVTGSGARAIRITGT